MSVRLVLSLRGVLMSFNAVIRHWPSLDAFLPYLRSTPRPDWLEGLTNHNTYRPNPAQWRGLASMQSMRQTYINNGWESGPHLYLVAECPHPADAGIWQMTPIADAGTHAGACNKTRLGIESVADWEAAPPTGAQYQLLLAVNRALMGAWGLSAVEVNVHKECMPNRTCPGKYLNPDQLRQDLAAARTYAVRGLPIYQRQDLTGPLAGWLPSGAAALIDMTYPNGAGHLASGAGFVDMDGLA